MKNIIGLGKFNRFYKLIIISAILKLLINLCFKINFQNLKAIENISILNQPILNSHIFIRFIYYYFGFIILSLIFLGIIYSKEKNNINFSKLKYNEKNEDESISHKKTKLISHNYLKDKVIKSFPILLYIVLIYIINEMIIFYFDQNNHGGVNFWVLEIFFIHYLLFKKNKFKLYKHQILSFSIIIILSFGIKFISSFLKQCEFPKKDPNDIDLLFKESMDKLPEKSRKIMNSSTFNETIKDIIRKTNEVGDKACKNMYNILLLEDYFEYFIILSAIGYLFGLFLHSFSAVKFKSFIDEKYISPYLIILIIGLLGFILNIILLLISSFIPCGKSNYSFNFCHSVKYGIGENGQLLIKNYYFDNLLEYKNRLYEAFHPFQRQSKYTYGKNTRNLKDGILEIIFSIFVLPILGFFKITYDLFIIKELGVFHLLISEIIYQLFKDLIIIIYKIIKGISDKIQITQFIFIGISNFFGIIGLGIYLELIEIRFCGFNENIKQNIIYRSIMDQKDTEEEPDKNNRLSDAKDVTENNFYLENEMVIN